MGKLKKYREEGLFSKEALKCIWQWSNGQKRYILILSILNIVVALISLAISMYTKDIVDSAVSGDSQGVIKYAVLLGVIIIVFLGLIYVTNRLEIYVRAKIVRMLRFYTVKQIMNKEYSSVSRYHSGELMNRMFSDVGVVVNGIVDVVPPLASMVTQILGASILLIKFDGNLVLLLFIIGLFTFFGIQFFRGFLKSMHKRVQEKEGKVHSAIQESIQNIRIVKASSTEKQMEEQINGHQEAFFVEQMRRARFTTLAGTGIGVVFRATWLLALVWGCFGIASKTTTYGTLMAVMQLVAQIQGPFSSLSTIVQKIIGSVASAERIEELFDLPDEESDGTEENIELKEENSFVIDFDNIDFSYGRSDILSDINFSVKKGDFIAVTGPSGGGKSTLLLLLLGVYKPTKGKITFDIDGKKIKAGKQTRNIISYVPQGNALFSGTIGENIGMFKPDASREEIMDASKIACIDEFILSQKEGLDTKIGERGIGLSEGQAQRVAIARAVLSGASILLLDESTSALDEKSEAQLLKNFEELKNKTCIIVTHRKAALAICNRIIKIENSGLTEIKE